MGYTQLRSKIVTTKKEHHCLGCNIYYPPGTKMRYTSGLMDGDFQNTYWCLPCDEFLNDKWNDIDEGINSGDCWNWDDYKAFRENFLSQQP